MKETKKLGTPPPQQTDQSDSLKVACNLSIFRISSRLLDYNLFPSYLIGQLTGRGAEVASFLPFKPEPASPFHVQRKGPKGRALRRRHTIVSGTARKWRLNYEHSGNKLIAC